MLQIDPRSLPSSAELPDSDDTPVDNEDQNFVPNLLLFVLESIWKQRQDWFFAVDMGVYHTTGTNPRIPVVPDGFLSIGVPRRKASSSRPSYVVWEEQGVVPILTLEVVSQTPGGEYDTKSKIYAYLGVLYYVIYNPHFYRRDRHAPFEVYKLAKGTYQLQTGEPFWMPELGLGIGRCVLPSDPLEREVLGWFNADGDRYLTPEEQVEAAHQWANAERQQAETERQRADAERQRADAAQQRIESLLAQLRSLGGSESE